MIRQAGLASGAFLATHRTESCLSTARSFSSRKQVDGAKDSGPSTAEEFVASLKQNQEAIRSAVTETRSIKSSSYKRGMTKVEITTPIDKLRLHAPASVIEMLKATQYYVSSSDSIVIRSDKFRQQGANRDDCFERLCNINLKAGEDAAKKERSKGPRKMPAKNPPNKWNSGRARRHFFDKKRMVRKEKYAELVAFKTAKAVLVKEKTRASASQGKK